MPVAKILSRLFLVFCLSLSFTTVGCSYLPWVGDEEEEDLAFEDEFPFEEDKAASTASAQTEEDAFFADDSGLDAATGKMEDELASLEEKKTAIQGDVENLQTQQEALVAKVRELEETLVALEPKLEAAELRSEGESDSAQKVEYLEPEVELLKAEVASLKDEIARLNEARAKASTTQMAKAVTPKKSTRQTSRSSGGTPPEYDRALSAYRSGKYDESILQFQNLALNNPPLSLQDNILFWIGSNYLQLEMYDDAIKNFEAVINRFPRGNKIHDSRYMLGVSYVKKGEASRAVEILQTALKKNPPADVKGKILSQLNAIQ